MLWINVFTFSLKCTYSIALTCKSVHIMFYRNYQHSLPDIHHVLTWIKWCQRLRQGNRKSNLDVTWKWLPAPPTPQKKPPKEQKQKHMFPGNHSPHSYLASTMRVDCYAATWTNYPFTAQGPAFGAGYRHPHSLGDGCRSIKKSKSVLVLASIKQSPVFKNQYFVNPDVNFGS